MWQFNDYVLGYCSFYIHIPTFVLISKTVCFLWFLHIKFRHRDNFAYSVFLQAHKIGIITNIVFPCIYSFRLCLHEMMVVNVKLDISEYNRIIFQGCRLFLVGWTHVYFWGHWNPCFRLLVFQSQSGHPSLHLVEAYVIYIPWDSPLV